MSESEQICEISGSWSKSLDGIGLFQPWVIDQFIGQLSYRDRTAIESALERFWGGSMRPTSRRKKSR